jgi:hypothetical protein
MVTCPGCGSFVGLAPSGHMRPWCPKCGSDLKGASAAPPPQPVAAAPLEVIPVETDDPYAVYEAKIRNKQRSAARRDQWTDAVERNTVSERDRAAWNKARKETAGGLFAIAGYQMISGIVIYFLLKSGGVPGILPRELLSPLAVTVVCGIGLVFAGLGWWALYQPLPPAIIGLLLFAGLWFLDFLAMQQLHLQHNIGFNFWIKLCIIAALIRSVGQSANARNPDS